MEITNKEQALEFIRAWCKEVGAVRAARVIRKAAEAQRSNVLICRSNGWMELAKGHEEAAEALEDAALRLDPEAVVCVDGTVFPREEARIVGSVRRVRDREVNKPARVGEYPVMVEQAGSFRMFTFNRKIAAFR